MNPNSVNAVVLGATGAVGREVVKVLESRRFPINSIRLVASERSAGQTMMFQGESHSVYAYHPGIFDGFDIVIMSAGSGVSKIAAPIAKAAGCIVIDNSTAFRLDRNVPLVIPEINPMDLEFHDGIIANPNCTTAITLMALYPLHRAFGLQKIVASSYQAVSGIGAEGVRQLDREIDEQSDKSAGAKLRAAAPSVFPYRIAYNVIPQIDSFTSSGYTREEEKLQNEGRKIMHHPHFRASVTCVRVPVYRAHSVSVSAKFDRPVTAAEARSVLGVAPGVVVSDDVSNSLYPMPLDAYGKDDCFVGRIREDNVFQNGLSFFVCGDQLRKGAALNAVQIAEHLLAG